jgi:hypothetical protein
MDKQYIIANLDLCEKRLWDLSQLMDIGKFSEPIQVALIALQDARAELKM